MKDKIRGKAEELKGKATGDRSAELKGKARQAAGEAKRVVRDLREEASGEGAEPAAETERRRPTRPDEP